MKRILLLVAALFAVTANTEAAPGFDMFSAPRTLVLAAPTAYTGSTASNALCDIRMLTGVGKIDLFAFTNGAGTAPITATVTVSNDQTNWSTLTNASFSTPASTIYTNYYWGYNTNVSGGYYPVGGIAATQTWNYPGVSATPSAPSAGFATPYLAPAFFTNSAAVVLSNNIISIGFVVDDAPRYVRVQWSGAPTGTVGAILTAQKSNQ
jgi:hypothetical protein